METENIKEKSTPKYKDSLIKGLVKYDDKIALEIANALMDKNYTHARALNLENLLTRYYGDAVIEAGDEILVIIEQQSTINNNMPLRILPQIVDIIYASYIKRNDLYKQKLYKIPAVKCFVLYNGTREWNPGKLKLSDAFKIHSEEITLELVVEVININYEKNHEVLKQSESLKGYSYLVSLIRKYQEEELTRDESIAKAVNKCIEEGILKEYLEKNLKEVINMLVYEYDEKELYGEARYEEGIEEGEAIGLEKGLEKGREEGEAKGKAEGKAEGIEKVLYFIKEGYTPEKAALMAKKG